MNGSPGGVKKIDPKTGKVLQQFPFDGASYDSLISADGNSGRVAAGRAERELCRDLGHSNGSMLQLTTGAHQIRSEKRRI